MIRSHALPGSISVRAVAACSLELLTLVALCAAPRAHAQHDISAAPLRRIEFQVERAREVPNDLVTAVLRVTHDDDDPARLANRVNEDVRWAAERSRQQAGIELETGAYYTHPLREQKRIRGWTASQELVLNSRDTAVLARLVAQLQEKLQLSSLQFSVSLERRQKAEDELIAEALAAYTARAELIRRELGASSHELVYLSVNTGGMRPPMPVPLGEGAYPAGARIAEPSLDAGTSSISVAISATIELR